MRILIFDQFIWDLKKHKIAANVTCVVLIIGITVLVWNYIKRDYMEWREIRRRNSSEEKKAEIKGEGSFRGSEKIMTIGPFRGIPEENYTLI